MQAAKYRLKCKVCFEEIQLHLWFFNYLSFSFCRLFSSFPLNDYFICQFHSTSFSYSFHITHKHYNAGCSAILTIPLPIPFSPVLLKPFETMNQLLENFPLQQKWFNYTKILPRFVMFRTALYKLFFIQILHPQIATQPINSTACNKIRAQIMGFDVCCNCCVHRLDARSYVRWNNYNFIFWKMITQIRNIPRSFMPNK